MSDYRLAVTPRTGKLHWFQVRPDIGRCDRSVCGNIFEWVGPGRNEWGESEQTCRPCEVWAEKHPELLEGQ